MLKTLILTSLACFSLAPTALLAQTPVDDVTEALESWQMQRLARQQNRPDVGITPFNSDGCSGGMSQIWSYLADTLPEFARHVGDQPPWEHCCVAHDRAYWQGATETGFASRELADAQLRDCVRQTGIQQGEEIAQTLGLTKQEVIDMIDLTGELMYQAVRIGGVPCTGLAWRWGHGWPPCSDDLEAVTEQRPTTPI